MKHILNDMTEEEKSSIREQHNGSLKVNIDKFNKLVESKSGDVKPMINEQSETIKINKVIQCFLNKKGVKDDEGKPLVVDGSIGTYPKSKSAQAIHKYQNMIGVTPTDGKWGENTMSKMSQSDKNLFQKCASEYGDIIDRIFNLFR